MKKLVLILLCYCTVSLSAQNYRIGMYVGPNLSFLSVKSDFNYYWSDGYNPGLGFEIGAFGSLKLSEKISFDHTIAYQFLTHCETNEVRLRNENGVNFYNIAKHKINNTYISISPQLSYHFIENIYAGTGINVNLALYSRSTFKELPDDYFFTIDSRFKNTYYKAINFGIPVFLGLKHNKFFFRLRYDIGMSNLMKDSNSFFREKENTLSFTIGYLFR